MKDLTEFNIIFRGVRNIGKVYYLQFETERGGELKGCNIPVDDKIARHILAYLEKFCPPKPNKVERGNEELDDPINE